MEKNTSPVPLVVLISAGAEWRAALDVYPDVVVRDSSLGAWFRRDLAIGGDSRPVVFFHGGWAKIAAAASTQYVIDRWRPNVVVNLGTCGGFAGHIDRGTIVLAERTLVYDIVEQMGDPEAAIARYASDLDLSWLGNDPPHPVCRTLLVSGDRDLVAEQVDELHAKYGAVAGDWESGAIAYVASRNGLLCLILRGVSDLVDSQGGEAYGDLGFFRQAAGSIMVRLLDQLPDWLARLPAEVWDTSGS